MPTNQTIRQRHARREEFRTIRAIIQARAEREVRRIENPSETDWISAHSLAVQRLWSAAEETMRRRAGRRLRLSDIPE